MSPDVPISTSFMSAVPSSPTGKQRHNITLSPESRAWLETEAADRGCAMSDVIEGLIVAARSAR